MRALLLCLVWTVVGTIAFARQYLDHPAGSADDLLPAYAEWLTCYLPWGLLSVVILPIERRFPLGRPGWAWHLLVLALVSVPMAYAAWLMTAALGRAGRGRHRPRIASDDAGLADPARDLLGHELLYWTAVAAATALRTLIDARENERRAARLMLEKAQLATSLRQAELDALRMRLQPHFLFNSLQNISVLTQHDPVTAGRMLTGSAICCARRWRAIAKPRRRSTTEIALTTRLPGRRGDALRRSAVVGDRRRARHGAGAACRPSCCSRMVENALRHGLRRRPAARRADDPERDATATGWC